MTYTIMMEYLFMLSMMVSNYVPVHKCEYPKLSLNGKCIAHCIHNDTVIDCAGIERIPFEATSNNEVHVT